MAGQILFKPGRDWETTLFLTCLFDLLTLRLSRFWSRTKLRRCFFGAVLIEGEPLEYVGKPHELLAGFAVSFAILGPLMAAFICWGAPAETDSVLFFLFSNLTCLAGIAFYGAANFSARRYLVSRLVWRGIAASQDGSAIRYAGLYLKWAIAFLLTAGCCLPGACADLARYRWQSTCWGNLRGGFTGSEQVLQEHWRRIWRLHVAPVFALTAWVVIDSGGYLLALQWELEQAFDEMIRDEAGLILLWVAALLWVYYGLARFRIEWLRWMINGSAIGPIRFYCRLDTGHAGDRLQRGILAMEIVACVAFVLLFLTGGAETGYFGEMSYTGFVWFASAVIFLAWAIGRYLHLRLILYPLTELILFATAVINVGAAEVEQRPAGKIRLSSGIGDIGYAQFL